MVNWRLEDINIEGVFLPKYALHRIVNKKNIKILIEIIFLSKLYHSYIKIDLWATKVVK